MGTLSRYIGASMVWLSQFEELKETPIPESWAGKSINPVAVFRGKKGYYLGAKGGCGKITHGNMDAGSFIFELNGVRWSMEIPKRPYYDVEKAGIKLFDSKQGGVRWTLLSKNNYGHSTLTVNNQHHRVNGNAPLLYFKDGKNPEAAFDITPAFGNLVTKAIRTFTKDSDNSLLITDSIVKSKKTKIITWQMITVSTVEIVPKGAILEQDGKKLKLECLSHPNIPISVVSLDPPPLEVDKKIKGLKRLEIKIPATAIIDSKLNLKVRLIGTD